MNYKIIYTPNGYMAETEFEARDAVDAIFRFAEVHPNGGAVTIVSNGVLTCYNIKGGEPWYLYSTEDLEDDT
jgi:hypothetical protein